MDVEEFHFAQETNLEESAGVGSAKSEKKESAAEKSKERIGPPRDGRPLHHAVRGRVQSDILVSGQAACLYQRDAAGRSGNR
jgi:hypothetical protein